MKIPKTMPKQLSVIYRTQVDWDLDEMEFPFDWSDVANLWVKWGAIIITLKNGEQHRYDPPWEPELDCKYHDELYFDGVEQELD